MNRDKLKLVIDEGSIFKTIKIVDEDNLSQGEIVILRHGFFWNKSFCVNGHFVGKIVDYNKKGEIESIFFYSLENLGKNISELAHKKELAKLRLGLIECPQLSIYLKDFGYEHGY